MKMNNIVRLAVGFACLLTTLFFEQAQAQDLSTRENLYQEAAKSLALRSIGPSTMGGRISDIKVDPNHPSTWYVAVGSGGVWKTTNSGTTWNPIFDGQDSYSIGTVEIDPNNSNVIWVGTGENVSGRHVAWGSGVYKSEDGGQSWKNMGRLLIRQCRSM